MIITRCSTCHHGLPGSNGQCEQRNQRKDQSRSPEDDVEDDDDGELTE